tara:strand:+ start:3054 stop:3257 length:204 start_codon:yes stop_codon:yes gene_type:complete
MAWKTKTQIYSYSQLEGTDASDAGNLAKDVRDFLNANDGTLDATSFPNISVSSIGDEVLVVMAIENS